MAALVLKQWMAHDTPVDSAGNYIVITGRESGLIAWFLARVGVDPTTTIKVSLKRIEFRSSSLSGTNNRIIPLQGVCSTYYGYYKPWKKALGLFIALMWLISSAMSPLLLINGNFTQRSFGIFMIATLFSIVIALVYYFLNRTLTLGFVENSGVVSGIMFKRSVIENIDINEKQARYACELTQAIIERTLNKT